MYIDFLSQIFATTIRIHVYTGHSTDKACCTTQYVSTLTHLVISVPFSWYPFLVRENLSGRADCWQQLSPRLCNRSTYMAVYITQSHICKILNCYKRGGVDMKYPCFVIHMMWSIHFMWESNAAGSGQKYSGLYKSSLMGSPRGSLTSVCIVCIEGWMQYVVTGLANLALASVC